MMDWTDRHFRFFLRLIAPKTRLYTEMITAKALTHGDVARHLAFSAEEQPVALQLGGSEPGELAKAAKLGEAWGYDEINLNCGCPSERVQSGAFGACLMKEPRLVAECVAAMKGATALPVTVKTRIGVDGEDSYGFLRDFAGRVVEAGADALIIHARSAWLKGLSPRENREIPPLLYDRPQLLKRDFPGLPVVVNGGLNTPDEAAAELGGCDGVMIGRAACAEPYAMRDFEIWAYGACAGLSRREAVLAYVAYAETCLAGGVPLSVLAKPLTGLYQGLPGAKSWRRALSEEARKSRSADVLRRALDAIDPTDTARAA
jgi:tRNA-dihydrouridine synthase A